MLRRRFHKLSILRFARVPAVLASMQSSCQLQMHVPEATAATLPWLQNLRNMDSMALRLALQLWSRTADLRLRTKTRDRLSE